MFNSRGGTQVCNVYTCATTDTFFYRMDSNHDSGLNYMFSRKKVLFHFFTSNSILLIFRGKIWQRNRAKLLLMSYCNVCFPHIGKSLLGYILKTSGYACEHIVNKLSGPRKIRISKNWLDHFTVPGVSRWHVRHVTSRTLLSVPPGNFVCITKSNAFRIVGDYAKPQNRTCTFPFAIWCDAYAKHMTQQTSIILDKNENSGKYTK